MKFHVLKFYRAFFLPPTLWKCLLEENLNQTDNSQSRQGAQADC